MADEIINGLIQHAQMTNPQFHEFILVTPEETAWAVLRHPSDNDHRTNQILNLVFQFLVNPIRETTLCLTCDKVPDVPRVIVASIPIDIENGGDCRMFQVCRDCWDEAGEAGVLRALIKAFPDARLISQAGSA